MRRILGTFLPLVLLFPLSATAQEHTEELAFLNRIVGSFEYGGVDGGGECEKLGDFIVSCRSAWTTTSGTQMEAIFITQFDPEAETFTAYRFYNTGNASSGPGWIDGNTSVFVYEMPGGTRARITQTWSGDTTTYEWHRSVQGGPWEKVSEGSTKRVG